MAAAPRSAAPHGDRATVLVLAAANPWDGIRMADRQLAQELSSYLPLIYVEPPTSALTRFRPHAPGTRVGGPSVREVAPGVTVLTPRVLPGVSRQPMRPLNAQLIAAQVRRLAKRRDVVVDAVIDCDVLGPILHRFGPDVRRVYWAQDDFVGLGELVGLDAEALRRGEQLMIERADVVFAANPVVTESIRGRGRSAALIPFGCDAEHFATTSGTTPADDVALSHPAAVFMGHLGDRIDPGLLRAVAERGRPLLLVGPAHAYSEKGLLAETLAMPNVCWVGSREFERLPEYLAHGSVGLLPYNHSPFNVSSFPLKTLEYLAAGLPVVATGLPAIEWLACPDIVVADDPERYADAVVELLDAAPNGDEVRRRQDFARRHTWANRAEAVARLLDLA